LVQHRSAATAANTAATAADNTCQVSTTVEYRPSAQTRTDDPGRCAHSYGSEGWGFESLRARPGQRPPPAEAGPVPGSCSACHSAMISDSGHSGRWRPGLMTLRSLPQVTVYVRPAAPSSAPRKSSYTAARPCRLSSRSHESKTSLSRATGGTRTGLIQRPACSPRMTFCAISMFRAGRCRHYEAAIPGRGRTRKPGRVSSHAARRRLKPGNQGQR
jgi:hypothetical protein